MNKNTVFLIVLGLVVLGVVMFNTKRTPPSAYPSYISTATPAATTKPKPASVSAGEVFADSPVSKMAYEVFPGKQTEEALVATKGWTIKTTLQKDGSTVVDFVPSEQEDKAKSYTVKKGETLYFVEINPGDDTESRDTYLQDDYGVIVDAKGIVQ